MQAALKFAGSLFLLIAAAGAARANTAYITNEKGNSVSVVDTVTLEVMKTFKVGQRPRGIALSKDDAFLFICAGDDDTIQIVDARTGKIVGDLPSGPDPEQLRLSPDGATLFVANENDALLTAIDIGSREVVTQFRVGVEPEGVAVSPDGKVVVNTSETTSMAHLIDWPNQIIVANILVDSRPRFAEFKPDGTELWVSSEVGGTVSVIDPIKKKVVRKLKFDVPGLPKDMIQPNRRGLCQIDRRRRRRGSLMSGIARVARPFGFCAYLICLQGIVWRESLRFLHQRERFVSALIRPLVWLFIFAAVKERRHYPIRRARYQTPARGLCAIRRRGPQEAPRRRGGLPTERRQGLGPQVRVQA
jgi:PQQ-dependent catabolism-associated beta-propeller protein